MEIRPLRAASPSPVVSSEFGAPNAYEPGFDLDDVPHARETWEQVVRSHPKSDAATQARALLASLGRPRR